MPLPDPTTLDDRTLRCADADVPDVLVALVRALAPDCEEAFALLERPPAAVDEPGVPNPRAVWADVRAACVPTWTGWTNEDATRRWHRLALPDHTEELTALADLTRTGVGQWFVHTLALARDDEWVLVAVPHSQFVALADGRTVRATVSEALAPFHAALVDPEVSLRWTDGDETFRLETGTLRVRNGRTRGWPLARVEGVERVGERTVRLRWTPPDHGTVRRVAGRLLRTPDPPEGLDCPDEATRERVADAIESYLSAYRPST
ncbi:hypothetical protein [Halomarina oriensis]|uniref:Uncharacterized protein n=1 Tax=Halomarina oriensis TaxID=671145 RepID=A0A6B0GRH4_9EURY|nr:hypothetical protein [Halomarina oriensis]MWG36721.1 hypothetical protein [Halomarina oriensis]